MPRLRLYEEPLTPCEKRNYSTIGEAERQRLALASISRRLCPYPLPLKVYHCSQCNAYHVGHTRLDGLGHRTHEG